VARIPARVDEMPDISVVVPAYNAAPYLPAALDSILQQSFQSFEIVVIDDCSKDSTWAVIQQYAARDQRIRPYRNERNLGIAGNRNKGVSLATGRYIAWQDADDISLPTRLEKQFRFLEEHPEVGIIGGFLEIFRGDDIVGVRKYPPDDASLRRCIFRYSPIAQPAAMLRAEALRRAGEYDRRYPPAEDIDMTFRIGEHYALANLQEVVIRYREIESSATFTRLRKMELSTLEIRWKHSRSARYPISPVDVLYNAAHFVSVWIVPPKLKIRAFNWWRNSRSR
jgi:glycosyltransferase involved in cell wall biosynthesis